MNGVKMGGFVIRLGQYHFRIWRNGYEYGNKFGGKVRFFPWFKKKRKPTEYDYQEAFPVNKRG